MDKINIKSIFRELQNHLKGMSPYQVDFIKGLKKYYKKYNKLSPKQIDCLIGIYQNLFHEGDIIAGPESGTVNAG